MSKKYLIIFLSIIFIPILLSGSFIEVKSGVRVKGFGDAFTGIADDVNCIYYNPAGLGQFQKGEIYLTYNNYYNLDLINSFVLSLAAPGVGNGTLGFSYRRIGVGSQVSFLHNYSEDVYHLSYGMELIPLFYVGANMKYLKINYETDATAIAYDIGIMTRTFEKHLSIGVNINNVNSPKLRWENGTTETLSSSIRIGLGIRPNNDILFGLDMDKLNEENYNIHFGAEMWFLNRLLAPRIGMALLQGDGVNFTGGMSIRYKSVRLDYALERHYELGVNHIFGILFKW